jgi:hypothetical protein
MATCEYSVQIDTNGYQADFKVKYINGKFKSLVKVRGKLSQIQHEKLMLLIPEEEKQLETLRKQYEGRVKWNLPEKSKTLHQQFVDVYLTWYFGKFGIEPFLKPQDFAALKWIKETLRNMCIDDEDTAFTWEVILSNWDKQDSWYQQQTELIQIKRNFNTILKILKHGKSTEQGIRKANDVSDDYRSKFKN